MSRILRNLKLVAEVLLAIERLGAGEEVVVKTHYNRTQPVTIKVKLGWG